MQSLVQPLEAKYPPIMQKTAAQNFDYILVLGSGGVADPKLAITGQLSATALSRFSEALRLYHANAGATSRIVTGNVLYLRHPCSKNHQMRGIPTL